MTLEQDILDLLLKRSLKQFMITLLFVSVLP